MSLAATTWAWQQPDIAPPAKLVLLALADFHNGKSSRCNPTLGALCRLTGYGERHVRDQLRALERAGLVATIPSTGRRSNYRFPTLNPGTEVPGFDDTGEIEPRHWRAPHPGTGVPETPALECPLTGIEPESNRKKKRAVARCTQMPPGFAPDIRFAENKGLSRVEALHEAGQFKNYHTARGSVFKVWPAAWRTWIGNAVRFKNNRKTPPKGPARTMADILDQEQRNDETSFDEDETGTFRLNVKRQG